MKKPHPSFHFDRPEQLCVFDLLRTPVWIFELDRHAIWWGNRAAVDFWQAESVEDLVARDFSSDSDMVRQRLRQLANDAGFGQHVTETWTLYPRGTPCTMVLDIIPVTVDSGQQAIMIEGHVQLDMTGDPDAVRLMEAARHTPMLVSTFGFDGQLRSQNTAAASVYGLALSEQRENSLEKRYGAMVAASILDSCRENHFFECDSSVGDEKSDMWHHVDARRGRDPIAGDSIAVVTEEDISMRVQAWQQLHDLNITLEERVRSRTAALEEISRQAREAREREEEASRAKSNFLANMSHELRTPLNAIIGFSDIMRNAMFGRLEERYQQYADNIHRSADYLHKLINDLLDLSRIEAGKAEVMISGLDLAKLVQDILSLIPREANGQSCEIIVDIPADDSHIKSDRRILSQILLNLLSNASKFTPPDGKITVRTRKNAQYLCIEVADTGPGIPEADLQRVLRPYEQSDAAISKTKGTGLGLAIAWSMSDLLGGRLELTSQVAKGTTATIKLPIDIITDRQNSTFE